RLNITNRIVSCRGPDMKTSTIQQTAKLITLLNLIAAELAFPAVLGFAWLCAQGHHTGPLGFFLVWLVGAGVILGVYAQFLRLWYGIGYPKASILRRKTQPVELRSSLSGPPLTAQDFLELPTGPLTIGSANVAPILALPVSNERRPVDGKGEDEEAWFEEIQKAWAKVEARPTNAA